MSQPVNSSNKPSVVFNLPVYELLPAEAISTLQKVSDAPDSSSEEFGEFFSHAIAEKKSQAQMSPNDLIVVPLFLPLENEVADCSFIAKTPQMFVKLSGKPQTFMTYGVCWAYSDNVESEVVIVGTNVKFPSIANYYVAREGVVESILEIRRLSVAAPDPKRLCTRQLIEVGERGNVVTESGTSKYLLDLDGNRYDTRNKSDTAGREKDLFFLFRALDVSRWDIAMGSDFTLQTEDYRLMISEQGKTRNELRNRAFTSCGIFDRIQHLAIFASPKKFELFLTGNVLVEGSTTTITLEDFALTEKITTGNSVCPCQNRPLVAVLRNVQVSLQVLLSESFENSLEAFILDLEGKERPLELVPSDFLRYSVEEVFKKFFRVVRSERRGTTAESELVRTPAHCAVFLKGLFCNLSQLLSDYQTRAVEEAYFRLHQVENRAVSLKRNAAINTKPVRKLCSNFLGSSLKAKKPDGSSYKCSYGKECRFRHLGAKERTDAAVNALIAKLPRSVQGDLQKALKARAT